MKRVGDQFFRNSAASGTSATLSRTCDHDIHPGTGSLKIAVPHHVIPSIRNPQKLLRRPACSILADPSASVIQPALWYLVAR